MNSILKLSIIFAFVFCEQNDGSYHIFGYKSYKSLKNKLLKTIKDSGNLTVISLMDVDSQDSSIYKYADSDAFWPYDKFQIVLGIVNNQNLTFLYYEKDSSIKFSEIRIKV